MAIDPIGEILINEGGYSDHPADSGGPTMRGITLATYSRWLKRPATVDELKALDEATAREIYEARYLRGPGIDTLPDPPQTQILDISVNAGPQRGIKMLQRVINMAGFGPVDEDGVIGPQTREACIKAQTEMGPYLRNAIVEERIKFYDDLIANKPSQAVFKNGWYNRANRFRLPI